MLRTLIAPAVILLAAAQPADAQNTAFQRNVDRPGLDYRSFALGGGPSTCQSTCNGERRCRAWTWVRPGVQGASARCWLKTSIPRAFSNACCTSGVKGQRID